MSYSRSYFPQSLPLSPKSHSCIYHMLRNIQRGLSLQLGPGTAWNLAYPFSHQINAELVLTDTEVNEALEIEGI